MGLLRDIGRALQRVAKPLTSAMTRSARHQIEDQYHQAMNKCARLEHDALSKLYAQYAAELQKVAAQKKTTRRFPKLDSGSFK